MYTVGCAGGSGVACSRHDLWGPLLRDRVMRHTGGVGFPLRVEDVEAHTTPGHSLWSPVRPSLALPTSWWWDFFWHRAGFRQSYNKWGPAQVTTTLLGFTHGRLEFTTVRHLRLLDDIHTQATGYERLVRRSMVYDLKMIQTYYLYKDSVAEVFDELAIPPMEVEYLLSPMTGTSIDPRSFPDAAIALSDFPSQNPLSRVWELRQIQSLMMAVLDQIYDLRVDLTRELGERIGDHTVSLLPGAIRRSALDAHHEDRGDPGDPRRRIPTQTYPPLPKQPKEDGGPRMMPREAWGTIDFWR